MIEQEDTDGVAGVSVMGVLNGGQLVYDPGSSLRTDQDIILTVHDFTINLLSCLPPTGTVDGLLYNV